MRQKVVITLVYIFRGTLMTLLNKLIFSWWWTYVIIELGKHSLRECHDACGHQIITWPNVESWLTHWVWATHISVSKLTIIGSDNGLVLNQCLLIRTLGTNFSEILSEIQALSFKKTLLKMSSAKWPPFYVDLYVLRPVHGSVSYHVNQDMTYSPTTFLWS